MHKPVLFMLAAALLTLGCASPRISERAPSSAGAPAAARAIDVYKSPTCGCCHEWEAYLRGLGYTVNSFPTADMSALKVSHGVPTQASSCHTAIIDGYVVEGHVPAAAIDRLLSERPQIRGIALPGMPAGSPGMGAPNGEPLVVLAVSVDGGLSTFGVY